MKKRKKKTKRSIERFRSAALHALSVAVVLVCVSCPVAARAETPGDNAHTSSAHGLIAEVIERYESADSYRLSFRQETFWALAETTYISEGVLLLAHPSMLSISYDDGSRIVSNGDSLWVYVSQTNQFLATEIDSSDVLMDPPRLLMQYVPDSDGPYPSPTPSRPEGAPAESGATVALSLRPRSSGAEPASMDVYIDTSSNLVRQIVAHARSGDYTRYTVTSTRLNARTESSDFVLKRPPGSQRLDGGAPGLR
jgi:outer membrane lipoprotein-sorting protein